MTPKAEKCVVEQLKSFIEDAVATNGGDTTPVKPLHRVPFHWPPHPVSKDYHVLPSDWTGKASLKIDDEEFPVEIARTAQGVFGRIERVWNEARGASIDEVLALLSVGARPYFDRQRMVGATLGMTNRFRGTIKELEPAQLVRLLYCPDRDVAHEAQLAIETQASTGPFASSLIHVIKDDRHPHRRSAQWCVLDMFEDLPSFCPDQRSQEEAVDAIQSLVSTAPDDYARTVYKAGVVLGGHICTPRSAEALFACSSAPSKYGRRSAIHAVFHLAEWMPEYRDRIVFTLEQCASNDPEPLLREFAASMARDIRMGSYDHMTEPAFPEES